MESFAGADLHKRVTQLAVLREGQPPSQFRFTNDPQTVHGVLKKLPRGTKIAVEAFMVVVCREGKGVGTRSFSFTSQANHGDSPRPVEVSLLKTSISVRRPTNGVSPRTAAACTRVRAAVAATTSKASTGRDTPLTGTAPTDFT